MKAFDDLNTTECLIEWGLEKLYFDEHTIEKLCLNKIKEAENEIFWIPSCKPIIYDQEIVNINDLTSKNKIENLKQRAVRIAAREPQFRARRNVIVGPQFRPYRKPVPIPQWEPWNGERVVAESNFCWDEREIKMRWNERERHSLFLAIYYPKSISKRKFRRLGE